MISVVLVAFGLVFLFVLGDVGYKRWISFKSEKLATQEFLEALNEENQKISRELVQSQVELAAFKQRDSVTPDQHFLNVLEAHVKTMNQMILDQFPKGITVDQLDKLGNHEAIAVFDAYENKKEALPQSLSHYFAVMIWRWSAAKTQMLKQQKSSNINALN